MPLLASDWDEIEEWLKSDGTDIVLLVAVTFLGYTIFHSVFPRLTRAAIMRGGHPPDDEMVRRGDTITAVVDRTVAGLLIIIIVVTILAEFGVNVTAIVAGLGVTSLALALGAQQLVRDAINGIFLLAEDQYRTGDVVTIAGVTGTVEMISLRRTVLRDDDGVVHSVPNGSITVVSNLTRDFAVVNVNVRVAVGEDLDRVTQVVDRVSAAMQADAAIAELLLEAPRVNRLTHVNEDGVTMVVSARVRPGARWDASTELRRRLTDELVREGIRLPYPVVGAEPQVPPPETKPADPL